MTQMTQMNADEMMIVVHNFLSLVGSNIISQDAESQNQYKIICGNLRHLRINPVISMVEKVCLCLGFLQGLVQVPENIVDGLKSH